MTTDEPYPWTRRDEESTPAYEAFRVYLNLGPSRTVRKVAQELDKSTTVVGQWSSRNEWGARVLAYDRHMETASTDGHADELRRVRGRHLELSERLLDHLANRLTEFEATNTDPSVRWTQAFSAATKAQEAALRMKAEGKEAGLLEKVLANLERLEAQ